jgi:hypothetical protein
MYDSWSVTAFMGRAMTLIVELSVAVLGTVLGGLVLALIFLLLSDYVFPLPKLNGLWRFDLTTFLTSYKPYQGMKLTYLVLIWQDGNVVRGTGEKVREDVQGAVRTYTAEHRSRVEIGGYVTKRYFRPSEVVLHFKEQGERRASSTMQTLSLFGNSRMEGDYVSTVANSSGSVIWKRGSDDLTFAGTV